MLGKFFDLVLIILVGVTCVVGYQYMGTWDMKEVITSSIGLKMFEAVLAIIFVRLTLKVFDATLGVEFKKWVDKANSRDEAIYFSARFIGTCLLFGLIIG